MRSALTMLGLLLLPSVLAAQEPPAQLHSSVDDLLSTPEVDAFLESLDERFIEQFLILVPELPAEDREVLSSAVEEAFRAELVRADLVGVVAADAPAPFVDELLAMRRSGAQAELRRVAQAHQPTQALQERITSLDDADRARLQLVASLTEARRVSERELMVEEALQRVAHQLANAAGGGLGAFEPLSDEAFEAAYRDRTLRLALESFLRLEPAPDQLIRDAVAEHGSAPARWYSEAYLSALLSAVQEAGHRVADLTLADAPAQPEGAEADAGLPCRARTCGLVVEWEGREPTGFSQAYGAPGDLERLVLAQLAGAGYAMMLGRVDDGVTLRLRARTTNAYCEVITGTVNRVCLAVEQVRVEVAGTHPGLETPRSFTVRNRCRANSLMPAQGIASLVAARIDYELTTFPGDERREPSC